MDNDQNNMQYDPNNAQNNMQYNPNNAQSNMQYNPNNGQNYQSNTQYDPNNTQYYSGNTQYDPNNAQYDPNNLQYNPNHNTVTSQMNGAFGEAPQSGSSALGIIGMVLGAILGGALWVLVGQMGYIVGIIGFFTVFFAVKGYELLGKKKANKGSIILAVVICLVVIFAAQYITYAIMLYKLDNIVDYSFSECMTNIGALIRGNSELMREFVANLLIGYVFTIVASFTFLRNGLKRNR